MKKKALIALLALIIAVGTVSLIVGIERAKSRKALTAYKNKLRAQGEKLTFEQAGYPFPLETNANLENFIALADQLRTKSSIPGMFEVMVYESPGRAVVIWAGDELKSSNQKTTGVTNFAWDDLSAHTKAAEPLLGELRVELKHPPRYFGWNYQNLFNQVPRNPYVQKRVAAQFLSADALVALRERQLPRAQADLHALTQLAQVHRGDFTLVSAMIRVAIAGVALNTTWQALPAEGWDEPALLALQVDWESLDLLEALETGLVGERMFGLQAFHLARMTNADGQAKMLSLGSSSKSGFAGVREQLMSKGALMFWHGHADADELFYLQHSEIRVENVRRLRNNASGAALKEEMKGQFSEMEKALDAPFGKLRHMFSSIAIPNYMRAFDVALQNEAQRRMTITGIALKRFQLQNGRFPGSLSELAPQFIAAELTDPWSGKPFHYRLNSDGTFTLYSVGDDGCDDGGNPASTQSTNASPGMWPGKDVVWPVPVFPKAAVDK
jgi:type II secretory pathway pseudopilin PulG